MDLPSALDEMLHTGQIEVVQVAVVPWEATYHRTGHFIFS